MHHRNLMITSQIALVVALSLLFFCAGGNSRVMSGYKHLKVKDKNVGVILVRKNISVSNPEDLIALGGNEPEKAFYDYFGNTLPVILRGFGKFKLASFLWGADERMERNSSSQNLENSITLPPGRRFISDTLSYIVILDMMTIGRDRTGTTPVTSTEGSFAQSASGSGVDYLTVTGTFVLWDNAIGTIAVYGNIKERTPVYATADTVVWNELFRGIAAAFKDGIP